MLTLRRNLMALIGGLAVVSSVLLAGGAAQAQGYPPGTSVPPCTVGDVNAGTLAIGQQGVFLLCGPFAPGAAIKVTVDGTVTFLNKTPVNGAVRVTVTPTSATSAAVDDPINVATVCGSNTVTATGTGTTGGTATANGTFNIQCASTATTTSTSGLAFTGANVLLALIVAMVLIVLGALLVVFQRRRRQTI